MLSLVEGEWNGCPTGRGVKKGVPPGEETSRREGPVSDALLTSGVRVGSSPSTKETVGNEQRTQRPPPHTGLSPRRPDPVGVSSLRSLGSLPRPCLSRYPHRFLFKGAEMLKGHSDVKIIYPIT